MSVLQGNSIDTATASLCNDPPGGLDILEWRAYRLAVGDVTIAVVGLGYVGAPLAQVALEAGCRVIAVDLDEARLEALVAGRSYIEGMSFEAFQAAALEGRLSVACDSEAMAEADAVVVCVPTPIDAGREPDLSHLTSALSNLAATISRHCLVIIESTTWPGTTSELAAPIIERVRGWRRGEDFFIVYSPEREDPGNRIWSTRAIPKILGADDETSAHLAMCLYRRLFIKPICVPSTRTAEGAKLLENTFRAVNIGLVNELKVLFTGMGMDIWEVIEAAETKPFGFMPFYPGPGVGGHCIPVDPHYLSWKARTLDLPARHIDVAAEVNVGMPFFVVARVAEALDRTFGRGLRDARVLVLGVAYKPDVGDVRGSPALKIIELLSERGSRVRYHDPFVAALDVGGQRLASTPLTAESVAEADLLLILTDHGAVDPAGAVDAIGLVVDTRNACARRGLSPRTLFKA